MATGIVIDRRYEDHDPGAYHPERPERIASLLAWVEENAERFVLVPAREASVDELCLVHDPAYVQRVAATAHQPWFAFDPDTRTCPRSYDVARLAAGGVLALIDAVVNGEVDNGFALVRPPGHHAERSRAMGFCLFNNVAIAAEYVRQKYGAERVMVVDWDVHHGNGTQHIFESDPGVLYLSTHQFPLYPGTGALEEVGIGPGRGFTVNLPLPAGAGDPEFYALFEKVVVPVARSYAPDFLLISAGFDAHERDPLAELRATEQAFRHMARCLVGAAHECCAGRCVAVLEGGYDLRALVGSVQTVVEELAGNSQPVRAPELSGSAAVVVDRLARFHRQFWKL